MFSGGNVAIQVLLAALAAAHPADPFNGEPAVTIPEAEQQTLIASVEGYLAWPDEKVLPIPPDGWYSIDLDGDTVDVFRDEYGVPHVFAPSARVAFRAQGYVTAEDRCMQLLKRRESVMGRMSAKQGDRALGHDRDIRTKGFTDAELQAMIDGLPERQRVYLEEYTAGMNIYLAENAPDLTPVRSIEMAAGAVYFLTRIGDMLDQDYSLYELVSFMQLLRGKEFAMTMLNDCMPLDVPTAPTTDHSHTRVAPGTRSAYRPKHHVDVDPAEVFAIFEEEKRVRDFDKAEGVFAKWGSQAWVVSPERSATGNALFFSSPQMQYDVPSNAHQVHLVAPGLNLYGIAHAGVPGVGVGHNMRLAWGTTSGMMDHYDIFVEELNPDNPLQYRHKGEWKDMEVLDRPIVVRDEDDELRLEPHFVYRTVHGPVMRWEKANNRAFTKCHSLQGKQLESFTAYLDMAFAENFDDFEAAVRQVCSCHHFFAADVDGNIGYWLAGRRPIRNPDQDPRLPASGTGEYDWRGFELGPDLAACINPPEGWFANYNDKPSVTVPGWWPEYQLGHAIAKVVERENPIDWNTFVSLNRANAEHAMLEPYIRPYLVRMLRENAASSPEIRQALTLMESWSGRDASGEPANLLMNEWFLDTMMEILSPDFGLVLERNLDLMNLQLFGLLVFRLLEPERAGIAVQGDYLHGRDPHTIASACFLKALKRLTDEHGPDMEQWPYEPHTREFEHIGRYPWRQSGSYWMAVELSNPMRVQDMLVPGACGLEASPHFNDQVDLFHFWQLRKTRYLPGDLGR
ncbi:MAG: penicillin acylase family protein [bacterium]|nr:penicillin acylase family protein [bacterium]